MSGGEVKEYLWSTAELAPLQKVNLVVAAALVRLPIEYLLTEHRGDGQHSHHRKTTYLPSFRRLDS